MENEDGVQAKGFDDVGEHLHEHGHRGTPVDRAYDYDGSDHHNHSSGTIRH